MKGVEFLTLGTTVVCLMALPTYLGIKFNQPLLGIIIAGVATLSYVLYFAVKRK